MNENNNEINYENAEFDAIFNQINITPENQKIILSDIILEGLSSLSMSGNMQEGSALTVRFLTKEDLLLLIPSFKVAAFLRVLSGPDMTLQYLKGSIFQFLDINMKDEKSLPYVLKDIVGTEFEFPLLAMGIEYFLKDLNGSPLYQ